MSNLFHNILPAAPSFLSLRSSGRFVLAQTPTSLTTYDLELSKLSITNFSSKQTNELRWLNPYHAYVTNGKSLEIMEFDGANAHDITALTTQFDALQTDDGKFIYSINAIEGGFDLQQSRMILE
jgi:hypothetical protein